MSEFIEGAIVLCIFVAACLFFLGVGVVGWEITEEVAVNWDFSTLGDAFQILKDITLNLVGWLLMFISLVVLLNLFGMVLGCGDYS